MIEKVKTIWGFLKNPKYVSQIEQFRKRKKNKLKENTALESVNWCKAKKISQELAIDKLSKSIGLSDISDVFPEIIEHAKAMKAKAAVKMGGEGAISFLFNVIKSNNYERIVETGVAYGWSSLAILLAIKDNPKSKLISNDMPYIKMNNEDFVGCVVPENLKSKWDLQRNADVNGIPKALHKFNHQIDCCHYDSDKSYTGRMFAYPILWEALVKGGLFVSDDIQDNVAFRDFFVDKNVETIVIEHDNKFVGIDQK